MYILSFFGIADMTFCFTYKVHFLWVCGTDFKFQVERGPGAEGELNKEFKWD